MNVRKKNKIMNVRAKILGKETGHIGTSNLFRTEFELKTVEE